MRYIKDIAHSHFKIGLYQWNGKYIIKVEAGGHYEQIYKIDETEFAATEEVDSLLDTEFIQTVSARFEQMHNDLQDSLRRNDILF